MAEDRIDSIIDLQSVQAELDATKKGVNELVALIQSVKGKSIDITAAKTVSEFNKLNKELGTLIQQTDASAKSVVNTTTAIQAQTTSLNENIKKQAEYKERIKEITSELKKLEEAQKIVNTSTAPGNEDEKKSIQDKIDLLNQELAVKKILDREINKTITNQVKEIEGISNTSKSLAQQQREREKEAKAAEKQAAASEKAAKKAAEESRPYRQLALAFASAAKEAQDLGAKYGVMDKRAQAAAKRANELNDKLKQIDYSIGNHQRNVGNYGSALDKVGLSLKNIAGNFLGFAAAAAGISGLSSILSDSIDEFTQMETNMRQLQNTLKNLGVPQVFDRISDSANRLQKQFGFLDNDDIIKTFNQLIVYGKLTEDQINELIPVIIDFATASGQDLASATSLIIKALEGNGKALKEYGINMKDTKDTTEAFSVIMKELKPRVDGVAQSFAESSSGGLAKAKQDFKDLKEEIGTELIPVLNSLLNFVIGAVKGIKVFANDVKDLFKGTPGVTNALNADLSAAAANTEKFFQRIDKLSKPEKLTKVKEELELINYQLKLAQDYQRNKIDEKGNSYIGVINEAERTKDLNYLNERKRLIEKQKELLESPVSTKPLGISDPRDPFKSPSTTKEDDSLKRLQDLAAKKRKAEFEAAKAIQEDTVKIQENIFKDESQSFDKRIEALRQFVQEKARLIELERTFEKGEVEINRQIQIAEANKIKDATKRNAEIKAINEAAAAEIEKIEAEKQSVLNEVVRQGHDDYNKILSAKLKEEEKLHKENADRIKKIHEDLQKAIDKGLDEANKRLKEKLDEREQIEKEKAKLREDLANESIGLVFDIITAQYEREKNLIQDQIDALERKKQKDIEVANATITNAQDRAAAISIINDRAQAEQDILEQKKRQANIKEAQFEKAESIANIIAKTAEAIIASLAKTPPPAGLPLAFLIGAIGAAQLARVIATPIPKYKTGTDSHKGGLAVVGDGGKAEGIKLPDGTILKSPATSTVMDLPQGTKVYPDFNKMMLKATLTDVPVFKETTRSDMTAIEVRSMKSEVVKAIKKIPQPVTIAENIISRKIRSNGNDINYIGKR